MRYKRTNVEMLVDTLRAADGHRASIRVLALALNWTEEKVQRVREQALNSHSGVICQLRGPGMMTMYIGPGSELTGAGNQLYSNISRIIEDKWGPSRLGLRNISAVITAKAGTRGSGVWSHPDIVVAADPRRRRSMDEPRRLHSIEVETADGFDLRSVYQAHAQGRGAEYCWVFGSKDPAVPPRDWDRVLWTAEELGVGVVTFKRPGAFTTWTTHLEAKHREHDSNLRGSFLDTALGPTLRSLHGL